jgi:competence protein ComEC
MSDRTAVVMAIAAAVGALTGHGPTPWLGAAAAIGALVLHRPAALVVAAFVLAAGLAARADAGLVPPDPGPFTGWATVLTDPDLNSSGIRADVRLDDGRHVQAEARADTLRDVQAGQRLLLVGRLQRSSPGATWLAARHIVGVLTVEEVRARSAGPPWMRAANGLRGLLVRGAQGLPERERPLFLGFVLGDTRGQPVDIADDFRGAGLSHLLAVSGQNVAFVLALAGPLLRRMGLRSRLASTLAVIGFFALLTRFEPSVLRASAMAALAVTATTLGLEASSLRLLALAVTGLIFLDPYLVRLAGFQLSVGACIGIVALSPVIARSMRGPRSMAEALSVTIGAQAGVAPILAATFGGVPVAGVPANLLAAPAAGPVMVWGMAAGIAAGVLGGRMALVLHWPTHLLIAWIAWVAHWAAGLPLGEFHERELLVLAAGSAVALSARRLALPGVRRAAALVIVVAVVAPAVSLRAPVPARTALVPGATLWRAGAVVLDLDGRVDAARLLEALRRAGVTRLDVVVARTASSSMADALAALGRRYSIGETFVPSSTSAPSAFVVGRLQVDLHMIGDRLVVDIEPEPTGSARGPPV